MHILEGAQPLGLTHKRSQLQVMGITTFILDISNIPVSRQKLKELIQYYISSKKIPATTMFNYKRGLK